MIRYRAILADPPWNFSVRSPKGEGRSAVQHYPTMTLDAIKAIPVADFAAKDSALFLWVLDPMLPEGLAVMDAWGFTFKTRMFEWIKTNADGSYFTGMGFWSRANGESCWVGTRGHPPLLETHSSVRRLIVAQRREHSRKPEDARERIERTVSGPYLEMFARSRRAGWDAYGNEVDKFSEDDDPLS